MSTQPNITPVSSIQVKTWATRQAYESDTRQVAPSYRTGLPIWRFAIDDPNATSYPCVVNGVNNPAYPLKPGVDYAKPNFAGHDGDGSVVYSDPAVTASYAITLLDGTARTVTIQGSELTHEADVKALVALLNDPTPTGTTDDWGTVEYLENSHPAAANSSEVAYQKSANDPTIADVRWFWLHVVSGSQQGNLYPASPIVRQWYTRKGLAGLRKLMNGGKIWFSASPETAPPGIAEMPVPLTRPLAANEEIHTEFSGASFIWTVQTAPAADGFNADDRALLKRIGQQLGV